jgi:protein arginine kinase activator
MMLILSCAARPPLSLSILVNFGLGRCKLMKCQRCEKPATFHITELIEPDSPHELHLCEDCAREYLMQDEPEQAQPSLAGVLGQHLSLSQMSQTQEELAKLDKKSCPVCGISFYEFRQAGRLGCPHDYVFFEQDIEPLIVNIHGDTQHKGKHPKRGIYDTQQQTELIRMRQEMKEAVETEDYERASRLRDAIRKIEEDRTN